MTDLEDENQRRSFDYSAKVFPDLEKVLGSYSPVGLTNFRVPKDLIPNFRVPAIDFGKLTGLADLSSRLGQQMSQQLAPLLGDLARLGLSNPSVYKNLESNTAYSPEMTSPSNYFSAVEGRIDSFDDLHVAIRDLVGKNPNLQLVWRGQGDSAWGLHSQLYRQLMDVKRVRHPEKRHRAVEPYPSEDEMVYAERLIIDSGRKEWRLDGMHPLEMFARLQHFGAPTRLLDMTRNPYIAAWFAVEAQDLTKRPGRLFALATHSVLDSTEGAAAEGASRMTLHESGNTPYPFWHYLSSPSERQKVEWGTGALRRYWVPPAYEQRILAQDSAFVLDGVPMTSAKTAPYFKKPGESSRYWKKADLLASSSIYTKLYSPHAKVPSNQRRFAPTFTFEITQEGKEDIRRVLEDRFSYSHATMFPDTEGLARYIRDRLPALLAASHD